MGFLKDIRQLKQTADAMTPPEYRGVGGGLRQMRDGVAQANQMLAGMADEHQRAQTLMATGRVGSAQVLSLADTGTTVNDNPVIDLTLRVAVDGQEPYDVQHRQTVSRLAVGAFQPGQTVPVRVDPANPQSLIVA